MKFLKIFIAVVLSAVYSVGSFAGNYLIREDRIWEYEGGISIMTLGFEYKMRFDGDTVVDGKLYHNLCTFDGITKSYTGTEVVEKEIEDNTTFLLREEDGKVYLHAPDPEDYYWQIEENEALIYDFNAEVGSDMEIVDNDGRLIKMEVISTSTVNIDGEKCKTYTIRVVDDPWLEFTVVQGIGNVSMGCIPLFIVELATRSRGKSHLPALYQKQFLVKVTDLEGNVICEKGADGRWPWEVNDNVTKVETGTGLSYSGGLVTAGESYITICDLSGMTVAGGHGEVSTAGLQPGVYVARAGGKSLKIIVRE